MDGDPDGEWKEMDGWVLAKYAFASPRRLVAGVAADCTAHGAKQTQNVQSRWTLCLCTRYHPSGGLQAPRGHLMERAARPPLLHTHQTFVPVINTHIRNAYKYCRGKQKMSRTAGRRQRFPLCSGKKSKV